MSSLKKMEISGQKTRVLVADDNPFNSRFLADCLKFDHDMQTVEDIGEIVDVITVFDPDFVILNLDLQNFNGMEVLNRLKGHALHSQIQVICLSMDHSPNLRQSLFELGETSLITTPFTKEILLSELRLLEATDLAQVSSHDFGRKYFIAKSSEEKDQAIHGQLRQWLSDGEKTVVISLSSGANFCTTEEIESVRNESLYFLQLKGSAIAKLPFMDDLSPFLFDIERFIGADTNQWQLIIEDPDILLNIYENSNSMGSIMMFSELLDRNFKNVYYYSKKSQTLNGKEKLARLANLLTGNV